MPRMYRVIIEYTVRASIPVTGNDAADTEEAAELAIEEFQNSTEGLVAESFDVVDIIEED